jgi:hypothetical protein
MTVGRLRREMSASEFESWIGLEVHEAQQREKARKEAEREAKRRRR